MNSDNKKITASIIGHVRGRYAPDEYPALTAQTSEWLLSRPLDGVKILDNTPLFTNTLLKYVPLLAAGAELTGAVNSAIPFDHALPPLLEKWGLPVVRDCRNGDFDCVLDCGGANAHIVPKYGTAELTRSGFYHYKNAAFPVILVDDSRIKAIETCLGTGDGFLRGMKALGHTDFKGKKVVIFGFGKVGRGIAYYSRLEGAEIAAVDEPDTDVPEYVHLVDRHDVSAVRAAVRSAWCAVTATGVKDAMKDNGAAAELLAGEQLAAAMGIEDEWGGELPPKRILNNNVPLNFMLDEPTRMRYIDPTMALSNAAALELVSKELPPGIQKISSDIEKHYWATVEKHGVIASELKGAGL